MKTFSHTEIIGGYPFKRKIKAESRLDALKKVKAEIISHIKSTAKKVS